MKRIAFFIQHMLCGGVEKAIIALSKELAINGNEVTIYVIRNYGTLMTDIPAEVTCREIPIPDKIKKIIPVGGIKLAEKEKITEKKYFEALSMAFHYFIGNKKYSELNVNYGKILELPELYDIAVNFHIHSPFLVRYLSEKVHADIKYTWIHNDFENTNYDVKGLKKYLDCCSNFFAVSEKIADEFKELIPDYKGKTSVIHNMIPEDEIIKESQESATLFATIPTGTCKLLSVGRLEYQKGFDISILVCKELKQKGHDFQWFIFGEGSEYKRLEKMIVNYGLEDTIHLMGVSKNPYPYFKQCDLYIQTSRHEGWGITLTEAKIFERPIVCTDFAGAREQIQNGYNGYIVSESVEEITRIVSRLLEEPEERKRLTKNSFQASESKDKEILNFFNKGL